MHLQCVHACTDWITWDGMLKPGLHRVNLFFSPPQSDLRGSWSNSQSLPRMSHCKVSAAESYWRAPRSPATWPSVLQASRSSLRDTVKSWVQIRELSAPTQSGLHGNSTLWTEMSVVFFLMAEHVDDVHHQLQQLSVESLPLIQRCTIRTELQYLRSFC